MAKDLRQQQNGSIIEDPFDHHPARSAVRQHSRELQRTLDEAVAAGDTALVERILATLTELERSRKGDFDG